MSGGGESKWYFYASHRDEDSWRQRRVEATSPDRKIGASAEWNVLSSDGFGYGFQIGRNGSESDLGLDLYAGRLGTLWCRFRSPWTKWVRIPQGGPDWYTARHTGIRFLPHKGCLVRGEWDALDGHWSSKWPWWRSWSITKNTVFGRIRSETDEGESGMTRVPLPEGNYNAMWRVETHRTYYVGWLGKIRDRILGPATWTSVNLDIPGGIPVEGKGENSYDCGMDAVFGTSGKTVEEAVGNCVRSVLRSRQRYGGPHDLSVPMTVTEAEGRPR